MSVSLVGVTSGNSEAATSTSQSTSFHADWAADDVAVLFVGFGGSALTLDSGTAGWSAVPNFSNPTTQGSASRAYAYYRVLAGGDTAPTLNYSGNITGGWTMAIFRGVDTSSPIGQSNVATASGTSVNISALTGVLAQSMLWTVMHARVPSGTAVPSAWTPDADYTQPTEANHATSRSTGSSQNLRFGGGYRAIASAGNYGGDTFSTDQTSSIISLHVELVAAATAQVIEITQAAESDTAQSVAVNNPIDVEITQVVESDTAQSLTVNNPIITEITQVTESDTAQAVSAVNVISAEITQVIESDTAQALGIIDPITQEITRVVESDTALNVIVDHVPPEPFVPTYEIRQSRWAESYVTTNALNPQLDLNAWIGQRQATYKFFLINGTTGEQKGEIHPLRSNPPVLTHDVSRTVKRSISPFVLGVDDSALVNVLNDRVLVYMVLGDVEFAWGKYMFASHTKMRATGGTISTSTLVDEMFMIDQEIERSYTVGVIDAQSTIVVDSIPTAIQKLIADFNITYVIETTPYFSIGSWPAGTNRGRILETLALDGDYLQPWFANDGQLKLIRSFDPADRMPDLDWDTHNVVIRGSITETDDVISAPNRIIVISNSGNATNAITGSYDIPSAAPYSIDSRGFVVPRVIELQLHTSAQANAVARNIGQRGMVFEQADLTTPPDPRHDSHNVIRWDNQNWLETAWSLPLTEGSEMRHTLRKVYE